MPPFLSLYWIPVLRWVYDIDATIRVMSKMFFFSYSCDHAQTAIL